MISEFFRKHIGGQLVVSPHVIVKTKPFPSRGHIQRGQASFRLTMHATQANIFGIEHKGERVVSKAMLIHGPNYALH